MSKEYIRTTWIGKIFSNITALRFDDSTLVLLKGSEVLKSYNWREITQFSEVKKYIFNTKVIFKNSTTTISVSFLKQSDLSKLQAKIDKYISNAIEDHIFEGKELFVKYVENEYLRDSNIKVLNDFFLPLKEGYKSQKEIWKKNLPSNQLKKLMLCLVYFPLNENGSSLARGVFEKRTLNERQKFYDNVESNPLTNEQRLAVIRDNDRNLVLAAAGTGKTSVMVAKALDLIDRHITSPDKILILAYNKSAAIEIEQRLLIRSSKLNLNKDLNPKVMTFHALGRKILSDSKESVRLSKFAEDSAKVEKWLSDWFEKRMDEDPDFIILFINLIYQPVNPFHFKSKEEYDRHIRDNNYRTLQGDDVKSYQELLIANWLYLNKIDYEYEPKYVSKRRIEIGFDYCPDFYIKDGDVYLEHFGISRDGSTRPDIDQVEYNQKIESKRLLHAECGTQLIETFHYNWVENELESVLEKHMNDLGVQLNKRPPEEVFEQLKELGTLLEGVKHYMNCLKAIRTEDLSDDEIYARLLDKEIIYADEYKKLFSEINSAYQEELSKQEAIDFDDMIIKAASATANNKYIPNWTHILVDEFQDISGSRIQLLQHLIKKGKNPRLTVVGDDWQSIYRFAGGKLELTTQFKERIGSCSTSLLQKTFRYNNSIADVAGQFVMENPEQYKKNVITHTQVNSSQVYLLDSKVEKQDNLSLKTLQVVKAILNNEPEANIAVLSRYQYLLDQSKSEIREYGITKNIQYWTFHASKGLEADYCILIGFFQGKSGFPNENKEKIVLEALLPSLDSYPHSEERRLLYVGMTRARNKSYLISDPLATSDFIIELLSPKYDLIIASKSFENKYMEIFKCPVCTTGHFRIVKGEYGEFYSCSSRKICNSKPRICEKCGSPSIDGERTSVCNNPNCANVLKICAKCGRPMRKREGTYGQFWGCSGYGIKDDQCSHTEKLLSLH